MIATDSARNVRKSPQKSTDTSLLIVQYCQHANKLVAHISCLFRYFFLIIDHENLKKFVKNQNFLQYYKVIRTILYHKNIIQIHKHTSLQMDPTLIEKFRIVVMRCIR